MSINSWSPDGDEIYVYHTNFICQAHIACMSPIVTTWKNNIKWIEKKPCIITPQAASTWTDSLNKIIISIKLNLTCLKVDLWYDEIIWQSSEVEHLTTKLRKSSKVLWFVRKASTFAPAQWAKHTSFPKDIPLSLTFSKGSQQSSIDSSNHLQGPTKDTHNCSVSTFRWQKMNSASPV